MPAIKIEMSNKWKIETAVSVKNIVMNAVKNTFSLKSSESVSFLAKLNTG